ncbi:MAG: Hsp70 family protein [Anaerolineaceae bacterium]|nr:Hsp70 family protein [Anaerolineaceae bacterium]
MGEAIGIDLGTTNSGAGHFENGKARILPTTQSEPVTPSAISYNPDKDQLLTGRQARKLLNDFPETTVLSIKRLMGRTFDDQNIDQILQEQAHFGYRIVKADDPQDRGIRVQIGEQKYSPVDISAMILARVKNDASHALGNRSVSHAVITVPAYFNERQRAATRQAGEKAGLIVKKIIDEPTAAAVAFGMDHPTERYRLLVYDLGGGTFDISLIQMTQQRFAVMGIEGDNWLGGDDFDAKIVQQLINYVQDKTGLDVSHDTKFLVAAKEKAEEAKIALSSQDTVSIYGRVDTQTGQAVTLDVDISRAQFELWIQPYLERSLDLVDKLLVSENLSSEDITAVLLVGGSTNIPLVRKTIYDKFGPEKVRHSLDPMQCVALGASILAIRLKVRICPQCGHENAEDTTECEKCRHNLKQTAISGDISLGEVTPQSLGLEVVRGQTPGMFSPIIEKGTIYPVKTERVYYTTSDRRLRLPIYQGEHDLAARNELQAIVEFDLPESVPPKTPVSVTFGLDRDQVFTISIQVQGYPHLVFEKIIKRDQPRPTGDSEKPEAQSDETWQRILQRTMAIANNFIKQYGTYLATGIQIKLTGDIDRGRQALREENMAEGKRITEAITKTILGSGAATQLFFVERIIDDVGESEAKVLKRAVRELQTAHDNDDTEREEQLTNALKIHVDQLFEKKQRQMRYKRPIGPEGLLLEELWGG